MNRFGKKVVFTSFGESHGRAIGGVLDGVPAGIAIDMSLIRSELDRRAGRKSSGMAAGVSARAAREADEVEWLSGVLDGKTLGTPIAFLIRNKDARPEDYEWLKHNYRYGHADFTYERKYGVQDYRGGGRASARETAGRVVAGCLARQLLALQGIHIHAELVQVGMETRPECFDEYIAEVRREGDSVGGIVRCTVTGLPVGLGEPIFDKVQSHLAYAMLSINACKGFDYGSGFEGIGKKGSEMYIPIAESGGQTPVGSGGMLGGITDGTPLVFRCVFKPTPSNRLTLNALQQSLPEKERGACPTGRHDACVAVRAVPVVEAMTALVIANEEELPLPPQRGGIGSVKDH